MTSRARLELCLTSLLTACLACGPQTRQESPPEQSPPEQPVPAQAPDRIYDDPSFTALGPPPTAGWRTRVREPPQTLADYQESSPNRPEGARRILYLQPIGAYPSEPVLAEDLPSIELEEQGFVTFVFSPAPEHLAQFVASFWALPAAVRPEIPLADLGLEPARIHNHHAQYDANQLLAAVGPALPTTPTR